MKKIMMIAVLMMANVVYGQWLPVSVNTNTGVFKPIDIGSSTAGLTNAYHTSGTVDRAYVSGRSVVVQFNTNPVTGTTLTSGSYTQQIYTCISTNPFGAATAGWKTVTTVSNLITPRTAKSSYLISYSVPFYIASALAQEIGCRLICDSNVIGIAGATTNTSIGYGYQTHSTLDYGVLSGTTRLEFSNTNSSLIQLQVYVGGGGVNFAGLNNMMSLISSEEILIDSNLVMSSGTTYTFGNTNTSAGVVTANGSSVLIGTNAVASTMVLTSLYSNANSAYTSNGIGYIVFSTNSSSAPTPPWDRPYTNYNGSLLWYSFDATNPPYIADITGNTNNGYEVFGGAPVNMWSNYAYKVSAIQENYITSSNSGIANGSAELTLALWLNPASTLIAPNYIMGNNNPTNSEITWVFVETGLLKFLMTGEGGVAANIPTNSLTAGSWHRLVYTYSKQGVVGTSTAKVSVYIDGVAKTNITTAFNMFVPAPEKWWFGGYGGGFGSWTGIIDDPLVANTAWTLGQVTNDYNAGRTLAP